MTRVKQTARIAPDPDTVRKYAADSTYKRRYRMLRLHLSNRNLKRMVLRLIESQKALIKDLKKNETYKLSMSTKMAIEDMNQDAENTENYVKNENSSHWREQYVLDREIPATVSNEKELFESYHGDNGASDSGDETD